MGKSDKGGMKSAYELAMERLEKKEGKLEPLSADQKRDMAEIERRTQARLAELEILMGKKIAEARAKGDPEELKKLEEQKTSEMARVRSSAESDKARVRRGA